jgi:hypothetical protein
MKSLSYILFSLSLCFPIFGQDTFSVSDYDPNATYSALSIVDRQADDAADILFYQALKNLASGDHSLTDETDFKAIKTGALQETTPTGAPTAPPADTTPPDTDGDGESDLPPDDDAGTGTGTDVQNARLVSVSVRGQIGAGDDKRIMGFILSASGDVLMRGIGPTLSEYGLPAESLLPDPIISLFKYNDATDITLGSTAVSGGDNDNYTTNSNTSSIESARTSLTPVVNLNAVQAVSLPTLATGFYTCQVEDVNGGTGIGVAAVDLVNSPSSSFTHLSSRGPVSTGEFMFGSFQITGTGSRKVYIRGRGPSLSLYGVPNVMADTKIVLYKYVNDPNDDQSVDPAVLVGENDNFGTNSNASDISSLSTSLYGWPVIETSEAALLIDLDPGYYSAQLQSTSSENDGNGWIGIDDVTDN